LKFKTSVSSFKEAFRKAIEQSEQEIEKNPESVIHIKTTPQGYLLVSSLVLIGFFSLLVFFGPQTLLSSEYVTVKGVFQEEDLVYQAGGKVMVQEDSRSFGYYHYKGGRKKSGSNGRRFKWQVISYKKENPEQFVYAFGLDGNLSDLSHPTLHNFMLIALVFTLLLNLLFVRWASGKRAKKFMDHFPSEKPG